MPVARKELDFEHLFQLLDLSTQRRLRRVEQLGRTSDVQLLCYNNEVPKMSDLHRLTTPAHSK
jgi:hypothetical protein